MSDWVIPEFSRQADQVFIRLTNREKGRILYLAQLLEDLVESQQAEIVDNRRHPPEYKYFWKTKGYRVKFYFASQSNIPVFTEIQAFSSKVVT